MVYLLLSMSAGQGTSYCVTIMSHVGHKMFSASAMFAVHIVVDVLAMVLVLLGPRAREGMYNEGGRGIRNTFQNLFKFISDPNNFCWLPMVFFV